MTTLLRTSSRLAARSGWLRVSLCVVLGGWLADRLAARLLFGSRSDRGELLLLIKRLHGPSRFAHS